MHIWVELCWPREGELDIEVCRLIDVEHLPPVGSVFVAGTENYICCRVVGIMFEQERNVFVVGAEVDSLYRNYPDQLLKEGWSLGTAEDQENFDCHSPKDKEPVMADFAMKFTPTEMSVLIHACGELAPRDKHAEQLYRRLVTEAVGRGGLNDASVSETSPVKDV